jgi:hypothetical protein
MVQFTYCEQWLLGLKKSMSRLFASLCFRTDCMCSFPAWRGLLSWTVEHQRCCRGNVRVFPSSAHVGLGSQTASASSSLSGTPVTAPQSLAQHTGEDCHQVPFIEWYCYIWLNLHINLHFCTYNLLIPCCTTLSLNSTTIYNTHTVLLAQSQVQKEHNSSASAWHTLKGAWKTWELHFKDLQWKCTTQEMSLLSCSDCLEMLTERKTCNNLSIWRFIEYIQIGRI